jgi:hypothetical protein
MLKKWGRRRGKKKEKRIKVLADKLRSIFPLAHHAGYLVPSSLLLQSVVF